MAEARSLRERISNRLFGIPAVAQWWAKVSAGRTDGLVSLDSEIPFAPFGGAFADATVALITTGGVHLPNQQPFDMDNPDGDATYREIPGEIDPAGITITHKYYDHTDADVDLNVVFPLGHFQALARQGVIGRPAPRHFGFMGHIDADQVSILNGTTAPEVAAKLREDGVDFAFLTPA